MSEIKSILTGSKKSLSSLGDVPEEINDIFVTKYPREDAVEVCSYISTKDNKHYCYFALHDKPVDEVVRDSIFAYTNGELYGGEEESKSTLVEVLTNAISNNEIEIVQDKEADVTLYC